MLPQIEIAEWVVPVNGELKVVKLLSVGLPQMLSQERTESSTRCFHETEDKNIAEK